MQRSAALIALISCSACGPTPNPPPFVPYHPHKFAGSAELHWQAPLPAAADAANSVTDNTIDRYYIHYGPTPQATARIVEVPDPAATGFTVTDLSPGTYYFSVAAHAPAGEGQWSKPVSKTVVE
jgi:hypothetical protein